VHEKVSPGVGRRSGAARRWGREVPSRKLRTSLKASLPLGGYKSEAWCINRHGLGGDTGKTQGERQKNDSGEKKWEGTIDIVV